LEYCTKTDRIETFNVLFWTIPFDKYSWLLLGLSILALNIVTRENEQWICLIGISLRQSDVYLHKKKILILFVLVTIVTTCCYESIISGMLTVPPRVIPFGTLKELIDNNFKIAGASGYENRIVLKRIFELQNITSRDFDSVILEFPETHQYYWDPATYMSYCNVSRLFQNPLEPQRIQLFINENWDPSIKCHKATETRMEFKSLFTYIGSMKSGMYQLTKFLWESGIVSMFIENELRVLNYQTQIAIGKDQYRKSNTMETMNVNDWKLISIFIGWGGLLVIGLLVFIGEYFFRTFCKFFMTQVQVYRNHTGKYIVSVLRLIRFYIVSVLRLIRFYILSPFHGRDFTYR